MAENSRASWRTVFGLLSIGVIMLLDYKHNISHASTWHSNMTFIPMVVASGLFWSGLTFRPPSSAIKRYVYLWINFGIVLLGVLPLPHLPHNLWVLQIYGAIGMIAFHFMQFEWRNRDDHRRWNVCRHTHAHAHKSPFILLLCVCAVRHFLHSYHICT
jgi:hypothetical protein